MSEVISSAFLAITMKKSLKEKVLSGQIPNHIAIIMDGNGRWAKEKALPRIAGHREGINSVREITRICGNIGVKHLTLYTFSTENWSRPSSEANALMTLLMKTIKQEIFAEIWIQPSSGDAGNSIGSALYAYYACYSAYY